ncbi:reverse transcriptase domain-containing protein [Tanacetum coccineum]
MAPLPPREQRHLFLRYQGLEYTDEDIADFKEKVKRIYSREIHRVQFVDFQGMPVLMRDGLFTRMGMEHCDDVGVVVFSSRAWGRLFDTRGTLLGRARRRLSWRQFILALGLHTEEEMESLSFAGYWSESERMIPGKRDLHDYWRDILTDGDFLGPPLSYTLIRDPVLRLCHRMMAHSIAGRKSEAYIFGGQFVARLDEYFGLLTAKILGGLTVIAPELPIIDMAELVRLQISVQFDDTWAWVAIGQERQSLMLWLADPTPIHAPPPPPALARIIPQRMARLEEDVHKIRGVLTEQREARDLSNRREKRDFSNCQPLNFKGTEGVVGLIRWVEKMETIFHISNCPEKYQVKYATCTLLNSALTWWNSHTRTIGTDAAFAVSWRELMKLMAEVYYPRTEIQKMESKLWNLTMKNNDLAAYTQRFQELTMLCTKLVLEEEDRVEKFIGGLPDNIQGNVIAAEPIRLQDAVRMANNLMDQKLKGYALKNAENKRKFDNSQKDNRGQQPPFKRQNVGGQNVARAYMTDNNERRVYNGPLPLCNKSDCPKLKDQNHGNKSGNKSRIGEARGNAYALDYYSEDEYAISIKEDTSMDDPNMTMEEYIKFEEEKACRRGRVFNWQTATYGKVRVDDGLYDLRYVEAELPAIVIDDTVTPQDVLPCKSQVSTPVNDEIDFRISFDESDDEDYTITCDINSFSYKMISVNNLKTDSENDNEKAGIPSFLPPIPTTSYIDDLDLFNDFENKFLAIV